MWGLLVTLELGDWKLQQAELSSGEKPPGHHTATVPTYLSGTRSSHLTGKLPAYCAICNAYCMQMQAACEAGIVLFDFDGHGDCHATF
jgi:hypothetical protein